MAKSLLTTKKSDNDIYEAKIKLSEELLSYNKVKNVEQIKALVDFLEYLFLIQDPDIERKYEEYKREMGGVFKMTVDEIRKLHYTQKGIEKGIEEGIQKGIEKGKIEDAKNFLKLGIEEDLVAKGTGLSLETIRNIKKELYLN